MGGIFILFGGPFSKILEGDFFPGQRKHESGTLVDHVVLLTEEYWDLEILEDLGNSLGKFIKISEKNRMEIYTAYASICV